MQVATLSRNIIPMAWIKCRLNPINSPDWILGAYCRKIYSLRSISWVPKIIVFDDLIDYMEKQNASFELSNEGLVAPFKSIFS